jgi:hypothetical protein
MVHQDPFEFPQHFDSRLYWLLPAEIPGAILVERWSERPWIAHDDCEEIQTDGRFPSLAKTSGPGSKIVRRRSVCPHSFSRWANSSTQSERVAVTLRATTDANPLRPAKQKYIYAKMVAMRLTFYSQDSWHNCFQLTSPNADRC